MGNFAQRHCTNVQFAVEPRQLENWPSTIMKLRFFVVTHCGHYFIHFLYSRREKVGEITFLPSSSTSGCYRSHPFFSGEVFHDRQFRSSFSQPGSRAVSAPEKSSHATSALSLVPWPRSPAAPCPAPHGSNAPGRSLQRRHRRPPWPRAPALRAAASTCFAQAARPSRHSRHDSVASRDSEPPPRGPPCRAGRGRRRGT